MNQPQAKSEANRLPDVPDDLARRIKLLRRDIGNLLFHFTRRSEQPIVIEYEGFRSERSGSAGNVLDKILHDAGLKGTATYIRSGEPCVCFTEAPLSEFATLFRLNELAASREERPRYEPYGVAVNKEWLFSQGGRPVIYDKPDAFDALPGSLRYRFVPYDPAVGIDHTWEREWRVKTEWLKLRPAHTLVVVPSADEAAGIVHGFSKWEPDTEYTIGGPVPTWLAVSLDIFGFEYDH
jgi:hypothetical protein